MGKKAIEHRKKVAKRNNKINIEKDKIRKFQEIINQERARGLFDNNPTIEPISIIEGPMI